MHRREFQCENFQFKCFCIEEREILMKTVRPHIYEIVFRLLKFQTKFI